jgi:hypothetical protein
LGLFFGASTNIQCHELSALYCGFHNARMGAGPHIAGRPKGALESNSRRQHRATYDHFRDRFLGLHLLLRHPQWTDGPLRLRAMTIGFDLHFAEIDDLFPIHV